MSERICHNLQVTGGGVILGSSTTGNVTTLLSTASGSNKTISFPNTNDRLICLGTTDICTNKTIIGSTNRVAATDLQNTGTTPWSLSMTNTAVPLVNQVLTAQSATAAQWKTPNLFYNSSGLITSPKIFADNKTITGSTVTFNLTAAGFTTINSVTMTGLNTTSSTANNQIFCCLQSISTTSVTATVVNGTTVLLGGPTLALNAQSVTIYINVVGS
jgi:hypothetical protein